MPRPKKYPEELIQRGIRLALVSERPIAHIGADLGMHPETLRKKVRQHEADSGKRPDLPTSQEREEIRRLRAENRRPRSSSGSRRCSRTAAASSSAARRVASRCGSVSDPVRTTRERRAAAAAVASPPLDALDRA